jgi:SAM-dependent methyltransferase
VTDWWADFFDDAFGSLYLDREGDAALPQTVDFLIGALSLKPGDLLFDQCCGTGAISHAFAERGIRTTGVDQAESYVAKARRRDLPCEFTAGDAFTFVPRAPCDAAINWATSFGYSDDDAKNIEMLRRIYESLKPGGRFGFEYSNGACDIKNFRKTAEYRQVLPDGELVVARKFHLDLGRGMRGSHWTYRHPGGRVTERSGESRLYMPCDIAAMLRACGFKNIRLMADIRGGAVTVDSPRFICLAEKP